jgi:hypothetical protein
MINEISSHQYVDDVLDPFFLQSSEEKFPWELDTKELVKLQ